MSILRKTPQDYGPSRRKFDQDTIFGPFEVIDVGNSQVAVNEGVLIMGSSSISFNKCQYISSAKPQDLMADVIDESLLLTVAKGDFICILVQRAGSSLPSVQLLSVKPENLDLADYKRKENRLFKIARIRNLVEDGAYKYLDIEDLYKSQIIVETENWPPFTPIVWPVENTVEQVQGDTPAQETSDCPASSERTFSYKAIFTPGSIFLPQTMTVPTFFKIGGVDMSLLPVIDVFAGDEFWVNYSIDSTWNIYGTPSFGKRINESSSITEVIPEGPECATDTTCTEQTGIFKAKILEFESVLDGIEAKMYWRSDFLVYGWKRCPSDCESSSGSSKSSAIVAASWLPSKHTALFIEESPEVWFHDCMKIKITGKTTVADIDFRYLEVCEPGHIWVSGICGDTACSVGAEVVGNKVIVKTGVFNKPKFVNVTFTGVRKGFLGQRFPARTKEQYLSNENFINSAYPRFDGFR